MATSGQSLIAAGAQPVYGDLKDRPSLDDACQNIKTVITTANSASRMGDDNPQTVEIEGNRNLIDAASAAGVEHFVFVSAMVADANSPDAFLAGKGKTEEYLKASGMSYSIIAPDAFMDFWVWIIVGAPTLRGEPVTLVGSGARRHSFISVDDVAGYAVAAVDSPAAKNQRLVVGGPEPLSFRDAVGVFEQVLGRDIPIQTVAPGDPVPGLSEPVAGIAAALDTFDSPIDMTETAHTFGVEMTSLETFARRVLASAPA
jgi:NADH dehydrogenase